MSQRKGVMLAHIATEARLAKLTYPVFVQPKLNGNRCKVICGADGEAHLISSMGNPITSVPHITEAMTHLFQAEPYLRDAFDGELYVHGMPRQILRSIVAQKNDLHPRYREVELHLFDAITLSQQHLRIYDVQEAVDKANAHCIKAVTTLKAKSREEIYSFLDICIRKGFEGVIIRTYNGRYVEKRSSNLLKIKPVLLMKAIVIGTTEEYSIHGEPKDSLGALLVEYENGVRGRVGSGFTAEERMQLWRDDPTGRVIQVKYHELSMDGSPCPAIFQRFLEAS